MTNAEARFNNSLRPRKPEGSLGRPAQDGHLDSHTAPELCVVVLLLLLCLIQTQKGSNEHLFILTWTHSMQIIFTVCKSVSDFCCLFCFAVVLIVVVTIEYRRVGGQGTRRLEQR